MRSYPEPLDTRRLRVYPLAQRQSLSRIEQLLVDPAAAPPGCAPEQARSIRDCAQRVRRARQAGASVILMYGAHLVKNGCLPVVNALLDGGHLTHLATNGAGVIHDWELSFLGRTEESVRKNVATGTFGAWDETGRNIHLALMAGALDNLGYGQSLGRFISEEGAHLPAPADLEAAIAREPAHPLTAARADLLQAMRQAGISGGKLQVPHPWKSASIVARAYDQRVPLTVHPGIGYDIISNHPLFNGAVLGRAATTDYRLMCRAVEGLDGGVVLSVGSAIMAPQVFEKSLSAVNNLRLAAGRPVVQNHALCVVDIQDGGRWDWSKGEPPKDNPAYYLRFCKSYARMGGAMEYVQCDNVAFLHGLLGELRAT